MKKNTKLLVLDVQRQPTEVGLGFRLERRKALNAISLSDGKVSHDSGGRFIVIEIPEKAEQALTKRLPGARLVPLDSDVKNLMGELDSTESLFLDALRIRTSDEYRNAKKQRKVGETPEEKQLVSGGCVQEEF